MSHEVETMFYTSNEANGRFVPWHGLGTPVEEALTSADALKIAGLDWVVEAKPVYTEGGMVIPGYVANMRNSDGSILGIVSDRYKIVQNADAFAFTDALIGGDVRYETAGSLRNGKSTWLLARLPRETILGDEIDPYLCFTNTHDGTGAVKVCVTPTRVVCNNTLNIALKSAKRTWSCKHMGCIEDKLQAAADTLGLAHTYMEELKTTADQLANTTIQNADMDQIVSQIFPITADTPTRQAENMKKAQQEFWHCYFMPDIQKFQNTAWGLINAMSDYAYHRTPARVTPTYQEGRMTEALTGSALLDKMVELCSVRV